MTIDLILATVDRTDDLTRFLQALDAQTFRDFRLIVVGQSPDDLLAPVIERFAGAFEILRLSAPRNASKARNIGLAHVTGDLVAFPDDDCRYPPDLLRQVETFFVSHPDWDGLAGRAVDETGKSSAGRADAAPGPMSTFNLWRRVTTFTVFAQRRLIDSVGGFDETLGPGSGTPWLAGEDLDFVLRALRAGCSIYYDPNLGIYHPGRREHSANPDARQGYDYGAGFGRVLGKNRMPWWFAAYFFVRAFGASALSLLTGHQRHARFHWAVGNGRVRGWRSAKDMS